MEAMTRLALALARRVPTETFEAMLAAHQQQPNGTPSHRSDGLVTESEAAAWWT